jgi:4,5-dihydroxyphthalate decarboxylase
MLDSGEISALFTARAPSSFVKGSPNVARLFPNFKEVEQAYFRKTGIFPIMHMVGMKRHIYERHPWVARSLYRAFSEARQRVYESLYDTSALRVMLPWLIAEVEETRAVFGGDCWPYGLEPNRPTLEALTQYAYEQGLTQRRLEIEGLFAPNTLDEVIV